ncbi:MAG: septal ring lytic transglycosylase RlpA family protein [Burkholderiales bacterium]
MPRPFWAWFTAAWVACIIAGCGTDAPRRPGGYYLDDGPPAQAPGNLEDIPDAQPKPEPLRTSASKPYTALGKQFVPMTQLKPYRARGRASWYGRRYHGKPTASGEIYDMFAMSAAHPILPIPCYVRVTRLRTGASVVVRVNDRGPFHSGRLIDLSYVAAWKLGFVQNGGDEIEVELIIPPPIQ